MLSRAFSRAAFLGASASLAATSRVAAQTVPTVRISALPVDSWAEAFYADASGAFKRALIDVQITRGIDNRSHLSADI